MSLAAGTGLSSLLQLLSDMGGHTSNKQHVLDTYLRGKYPSFGPSEQVLISKNELHDNPFKNPLQSTPSRVKTG